MIDHETFGRLRLADFLPPEQISELRDWEYEGRVWVGDLASFPDDAARKVCTKLDLPLRRGMTSSEIEAAIGPILRARSFARDRDSHELTTKTPNQYELSCTVLKTGGLTHFSVAAPLPVEEGR